MKVAEYRPSITETLIAHGAEVDEERDGWVPLRCPFHDDEHKSASVNETEGLFKCFGCGVQGDAVAVVMKVQEVNAEAARQMLEDMHVTRKRVQRQHHTVKRTTRTDRDMLLQATERYSASIDYAAEYLRERGITRTAALSARLGYVSDPLPGHEQYRSRLSIPYITTSGVVGMKFRCTVEHKCKDHGHSKYLCLPGSDSRMFNVLSVLTTRPYIAVTEGEIDALILSDLCDIPAVGIPGANNWKGHYSRVLEGFDRIFVIGDGDKAGREFARSVSKKLESSLPIELPDDTDVNDVYLQGGASALMNLLGV